MRSFGIPRPSFDSSFCDFSVYFISLFSSILSLILILDIAHSVVRVQRALAPVRRMECHLFRLLTVLSGERIFCSESGFVNAVPVYRCDGCIARINVSVLSIIITTEIRDVRSTLKITRVDGGTSAGRSSFDWFAVRLHALAVLSSSMTGPLGCHAVKMSQWPGQAKQ